MLQQPNLRTPLAVSLGAIGGALSRYYLSLWLAQKLGNTFPYATLLVNLSGCLVMGFFMTLILEQIATITPEMRLLVAVGFLGSYTTFSTYELETVNLLRDGKFVLASIYWMGSACLGVISLYLGTMIARLIK